MTEPIEAYLDELVGLLSTRRPRQLRSLLAETEAHLRDDADAGVRAGKSRYDAEVAAVARFGPAEVIAGAERDTWRPPIAVVAKQFIGSAALLGGIAAIAVGISGLIALFLRAISSARFLVDTPAASVLTPSNCSRWLGRNTPVSPVTQCRSAAMNDWVSEVIGYRLIAGVLGVSVVLLAVAVRRRRGGLPQLPRLVADTIAAAAFTVAGVWLLLVGFDALVVVHGDGAGQWLSAAPVALAAAAVFGLRLIHDLQQPGIATDAM
jgi:hypothetical protein